MTRRDSSSGAESGMDDNAHGKHQTNLQLRSINKTYFRKGDEIGDEEEVDEGDVQIWQTFSESFRQVQKVLDQNRILIQQVNENHRSKLPDNLTKNVSLIREINGNISRIVSLYSDLSTDFSNVFIQRREVKNKGESTDA